MPESAAGFARQYRLVKPAQFQYVFKQARKAGDKCLSLLARANGCGHARLGLAISVKSAGNAVVRNRAKRQARESFRQHRSQLGALDFVVTARVGIAKKTKRELRAVLDKHWFTLVNAKTPAALR